MTVLDDDDTVPTLDDALVAALRAEASAPITTVVDFGGTTAQGLIRRHNEDAWGHMDQNLFVVADGMGGHAGGELAARTAVASLLSTAASRGIVDWPAAVSRLNNQVRTATRSRGFDRAGTALVALSVLGGVATIVNVGDARAYRLRGDRLVQLSTDHTVRNELIAAGIDLAEYKSRGMALNGLTRHLGGSQSEPEVSSLVPFHDDYFLLVTDGVFRQMTEASMIDAITGRTCQQASQRIVELADEAGGKDNATAVVLRLGLVN
jgi:PPM family protein phosphatase